MPTYAYACTSCDHRFEVQQSFSDATLTECPTCTGRIRKLFNSVGIVFKGSGFYRNDSRPTTKESSEGSSGRSSEKSVGTSTDKAPASTSTGDTSKGDTSKGDTSKGDTSNGGGTGAASSASGDKGSSRPSSSSAA